LQRPIDVLVYSHKPFAFPANSDWLRPMISRDCQPPLDGFMRNDSGENIAHLGKFYNEVSGKYWLWKNRTFSEIVGLCHYRRYFNLIPIEDPAPILYVEPCPMVLEFLSSSTQKEQIQAALKCFDVIVARALFMPQSIEQQYLSLHPAIHWHRFWEIAVELYPHYSRFLPFLRVSNKCHFWNMIITKKLWLNEYAEQLFKILEILTLELGFSEAQSGKRYQDYRYPAYLAERFLTFYLHANRARVYEAQVVLLEREPLTPSQYNRSFLRNAILQPRHNVFNKGLLLK
jgi:hypothetical protein